MHIVVKDTKTIDEYKAAKSTMEDLANRYYAAHKSAAGLWDEGQPVKVWYDPDGNICIEYESGKWWHYSNNGQWW